MHIVTGLPLYVRFKKISEGMQLKDEAFFAHEICLYVEGDIINICNCHKRRTGNVLAYILVTLPD